MEYLLLFLIFTIFYEFYESDDVKSTHQQIPNYLPVGSRDSTKPVERIGGSGVGNTVKRNLTTDQVDEESNNGPKTTLTERNLHMSFLKISSRIIPSFQGSLLREGNRKGAHRYEEDRLQSVRSVFLCKKRQ